MERLSLHLAGIRAWPALAAGVCALLLIPIWSGAGFAQSSESTSETEPSADRAAPPAPAGTPAPGDSPADAAAGAKVPALSSPASPAADGTKLVWTTMTSPAGREVRVLRPESEAGTSAGSSSVLPAPNGLAAGDPASSGVPVDRSGTRLDPRTTSPSTGELSGVRDFFDDPRPISAIASFGAYGGYPSAFGFQTAYPTDGTLAVRMGLTGAPKLGWLWTPGYELRFGQRSTGYSSDGVYHFSNLYVGQTTSGTDEDHWGAESGLGYRWLLPDRRGVRWIAGVELGGRWATGSGWPDTPSARAYWMIAAP